MKSVWIVFEGRYRGYAGDLETFTALGVPESSMEEFPGGLLPRDRFPGLYEKFAPPETPLGSALEMLPPGACCAVGTVLECPHCRVAYVDDVPLGHDVGFCGPCQHIAKHTGEFTCQRFRRRARLPHDRLSLSYRW